MASINSAIALLWVQQLKQPPQLQDSLHKGSNVASSYTHPEQTVQARLLLMRVCNSAALLHTVQEDLETYDTIHRNFYL